VAVAGARWGPYQRLAPGRHEARGTPEWNLRRRFHAGDDGRYEFRTVVPATHQIPHPGPVGRFLEAVGQRPWRPATWHLKLSARVAGR
jgi:catechol 1,2-dioxygenase